MMPVEVKEIWAPRSMDTYMIQVFQNQRKMKERLERHESILKEILCHLTPIHEDVSEQSQ